MKNEFWLGVLLAYSSVATAQIQVEMPSTHNPGDFSGDYVVGSPDLNIVLFNWQAGTNLHGGNSGALNDVLFHWGDTPWGEADAGGFWHVRLPKLCDWTNDGRVDSVDYVFIHSFRIAGEFPETIYETTHPAPWMMDADHDGQLTLADLEWCDGVLLNNGFSEIGGAYDESPVIGWFDSQNQVVVPFSAAVPEGQLTVLFTVAVLVLLRKAKR